MNSIRVTKYNPHHRDVDGNYTLAEEWTSISDVGKSFEGKVVTMEQYLATEEKYIKAIDTLLQKTGVPHLKIVSLENHSNEKDLVLAEGKILLRSLASEVAKMILREKVWGKLVAEDQVEIHFGHDYYMYFIGKSLTDELIEDIKGIEGLYVENVASPY